eukprot:474606_1
MGNSNGSLTESIHTESLNVYQKLTWMGFNEDMSLKAAKKYPRNLQKAANYILKNQSKQQHTSQRSVTSPNLNSTEDIDIKQDEKEYTDDKKIIKKGWVLKKGPQSLAAWRNRYIQLTNNQEIEYYTDESMNVIKGIITLNGLTINDIKQSSKTYDAKHFGFCVVTSNRIYQFCVASAIDRHDWIQNICQCIDKTYQILSLKLHHIKSISYSSNAKNNIGSFVVDDMNINNNQINKPKRSSSVLNSIRNIYKSQRRKSEKK